MHKKQHIYDLDIPEDDLECIHRYPKHKWVYELTRLLDSQNVKWSFYNDNVCTYKIANVVLHSKDNIIVNTGYIYVEPLSSTHIDSVAFIVKGEIKKIIHSDTDSAGDIELRISAIIAIHFQKFTGVLSISSFGNNIYSISLRPKSELFITEDNDISRLLKRIYKKNDISTINGLTDHTLHESTAS